MHKSILHVVLALAVLLLAASCIPTTAVLPVTATAGSTSGAPVATATTRAAPPGAAGTPAPAATTDPGAVAAGVYYVSRTGSNGDGRSWATAWNELDQIDWDVIEAGDTILIDGGRVSCGYGVAVTGGSNAPGPAGCGMEYRTALTIGASGAAGAPITVRLAEEAGRAGTVRIFGGRGTPLPYCGQTGYAPDGPGVGDGILVEGRSHLVIDGGHWAGIMVYGWTQGLDLSPSGNNADVTLRNAELYDNGTWSAGGGSDEEGITGSGTGLVFERLLVHDNGQDQYQTGYKAPVREVVFRRVWLYNQRPHPTVAGEPFNYCTHSDGIQYFGDLAHEGLTLEDSIVGPGLMQGVILGETGRVDRVTVRNVLFVGHHGGSDNAAFLTKDGLSGRDGYVFDHITVVRDKGSDWWSIYAPGDGYEVRDSLFVGGREVRIGAGSRAGNVCWNVRDDAGVCQQRADPQFVDAVYAGVGAGFADFDFGIGNPALPAGVGSSITSVAQLLADTTPSSEK